MLPPLSHQRCFWGVMEQLPGALTYPLVGNYGVPSSSLDEYGLPRRGPVSELSLYPFFSVSISPANHLRKQGGIDIVFYIMHFFSIPPKPGQSCCRHGGLSPIRSMSPVSLSQRTHRSSATGMPLAVSVRPPPHNTLWNPH